MYVNILYVCVNGVSGGAGRAEQHAEDVGRQRGARRQHDRGVRRHRQDRAAAGAREDGDLQDGLRHHRAVLRGRGQCRYTYTG